MSPADGLVSEPPTLDAATVAALRAATPGTENVVHFNNAGSALPPTTVTDTVVDHLRREALIGGYEAAAEAGPRLDAVYDSLARLLGASTEQVSVVENATRAWDMAVYGYPFSSGDRVLVGRAEYVSNVLGLLQLAHRYGIDVVLIDDDAEGQIDLASLEAELDRGAEMVAITHAPTNGGLINPAEDIGELCERYDTFYVLDACQSAGQVPLDVGRIKCDVLSGTGRKYLRGPRGTGFLYAGPRALERIEPPFVDLHAADWTEDRGYQIRGDARRFENWETNYAGKLGLGAAIDYALDLDVATTWPRVRALGQQLRESLAAAPGVTVADKGVIKGGIVTFYLDGRDSVDVAAQLSTQRINTSTSPLGHARFDLPHRGLPTLVRASVHYYNSDDEIDRFVAAVSGLD